MKRSSLILSACAGLLLLAAAFLLLYPNTNLPDAPLRAMPADVYGFVRVRVARVLASRPWREIVVDRKEDRGIQRVTKICGFNPLESLREIVVFALPGATRTELVVNARGALTRTQLIDCAAKFSGGSMASFVYVRVAGFDTARSKKGSERAAFIGRDGFIAGGAEGVSASLRALAGDSANAESDPLLQEVYASLSSDSDLALALRVPSNAALRAALVEQLGLPDSPLLADLKALSLDLHLIEDRIRIDSRFWLPDAQHATAWAEKMSALRGQILAMPGLGLIGVAEPLRALRIVSEGNDVKVHAEVKARTVNTAVDLLPTLAALQRGFARPPDEKDGGSGAQQDAGAR